MTNKLKSFLKTQTLKFKITLNYDVLLEQAKTINYPDEMLIRYTEIWMSFYHLYTINTSSVLSCKVFFFSNLKLLNLDQVYRKDIYKT